MSKKNKKNIKNNEPKRRKNTWLILVILFGIVILGYFFLKELEPDDLTAQTGQSQCQVSEMTFYYLDQCGWCQKVKDEGTLDEIEKLGIKVKRVNAAVGPIRHQFQGVPTFVIHEKVYTGYKTFEELRELLGCPKTEGQSSEYQNQSQSLSEIQFFGDKGERVVLKNGEIKLSASIFNDNKVRFYNVATTDGKTIYFFVLKDKQGIYRAAANACVVCFKTYKGFRQEGDEVVCNNCGNRYPIEKIATEKGGCNPGPINPNLEVRNGEIIIKQEDIEQVSDLF